MGCCNTKYKETIDEEEERINEEGKEHLSLFGKLILSCLFLGGLALIGFL
ncbi:hypothetical protein ABFG93_09700 [Pseudalkalibacillus hwajinpoensis]